MQIKLTQSITRAMQTYRRGSVIDVPADYAAELIAAKFALAVPAPEAAVVSKRETAVRQRPETH